MTKLAYFLLGLLVGWWLSQMIRDAQQPAAGTAAVGARRLEHAVADAKPARAEPDDDLTQISGIGPAAVQALHDIGIRTFRQLSDQDADALAQRLPSRMGARVVRGDWIGQARKLAGR
jgi:predicted flap endonuclease-1-like 5' DNA nuclease